MKRWTKVGVVNSHSYTGVDFITQGGDPTGTGEGITPHYMYMYVYSRSPEPRKYRIFSN